MRIMRRGYSIRETSKVDRPTSGAPKLIDANDDGGDAGEDADERIRRADQRGAQLQHTC